MYFVKDYEANPISTLLKEKGGKPACYISIPCCF